MPPEESYRGSVPENVLTKLKAKLAEIAEAAETYPHRYLRKEFATYCKVKFGQYRAMYRLDTEARVMTVVRIGPRADFYD